MSKPANPLDIFTSYTYHFELHAAFTTDDLNILASSDRNVATSPTDANGTCLINTRKDAHQIIDDVTFGYVGSSANNFGHFSPDGTCHLKISEPNRVFFIQKITNLMKKYNVSALSSLQWGLKIFFVGRTQNGQIQELPYPQGNTQALSRADAQTPRKSVGILIPLIFTEMQSSFTFAGSEYSLDFASITSFAGSDSSTSTSNSLLAGYCNKDISITAGHVKDALSQLQDQLNLNYKNTYATELSSNARGLKYIIRVDPSMQDGTIDLSTGQRSLAPGDPVTMNFSQSQTILTWIFNILRSSKALNSLVADSLDGIRKSGHPNVNIISVFPTLNSTNTDLEVIYDVSLYKGENTQIKSLKNNVMEFDFMFEPPGKNVDIIGFDINMTSAQAWFSGISNGTASQTGIDGSKSKDASKTYIVDNTKKPTSGASNPSSRVIVPILHGDFAYLNVSSRIDSSGGIKYRDDALDSAKLMFNSLTAMHGAFDPQVTITIRGNLDLLTAGIIHNQSQVGKLQDIPFGILAPLWIKVNVNSPDQKTPFFYVGLYNVISIQNNFSKGQFLQTITALMMSDDLPYGNKIVNGLTKAKSGKK